MPTFYIKRKNGWVLTLTCGVVHLQFISFRTGAKEASIRVTTCLLAATIQCTTLIYIYCKSIIEL